MNRSNDDHSSVVLASMSLPSGTETGRPRSRFHSRDLRSFLAWFLPGIAAALILAWSAPRLSPTYDGAGHLAAGVTHWQTGRFDAYKVNPPLPRLWMTLPLAGLTFPIDDVEQMPASAERREWALADAFFQHFGERAFHYAAIARLMQIPVFLIGAWLAAYIAQALAEDSLYARFIAATLYAFCPYTLAAGTLITPDLCAAVSGLGVVACLIKYRQLSTHYHAGLLGIALGLAISSKTTWIVALPCWMIYAWFCSSVRISLRLRHAVIVTLMSLLVLNAVYGFEGTGAPLQQQVFHSQFFRTPQVKRVFHSPLAQVPLPLPFQFIAGIDLQLSDFDEGYDSYFAGEHAHTGFPSFYLMATFLKTPPVHLIMILVALGVTFAKPKCNTILLLGTVAAVYIVVSRHTGFTNHVRYAAIAIPLLYLTGAARVSAAAIWVRRVTAIVVVVEAVSVAMWAPAFLSYRGPQEVCVGGIEHAIGMSDFDSTVDWGQHLLLLRTWLNRHPEYVLVGLAHNHRASVVEAAGLPTKYPPRHHTPPIPQSRFGHQTPVVALNIRALYTPTDEYLHFRARTPLTVIAGTIFVYELQTDVEGGTK